VNSITGLIQSAIENFETPGFYIFDTEYRFQNETGNSFEFKADEKEFPEYKNKKIKITVELI